MPTSDVLLWRGASVPTLAAGAAVTVGAAAVDGVDAAVGAALGSALVVGFFGLGLLVYRITAQSPATTVMGLALMSYLFKITLLALLLVLFRGTTLFSPGAFATAVLVCAAVWLTFEIRAFLRLQRPRR